MSEMNEEKKYVVARRLSDEEYLKWYVGKHEYHGKMLRDAYGNTYLAIDSTSSFIEIQRKKEKHDCIRKNTN